MKVGVLGGSFDPPHKGHLHVAKTLLQQKICQKIILIPCFKHPFNKPLSDAKYRLAMTKLLENENIKVSGIEVKRNNISYTIDTLKTLKNQSPKENFVWIMGEDQVKDFGKWKGWRKIVERFGLIIVPRYAKTSPRRWPKDSFEVEPSYTSEESKSLLRHLGGEIRNITFLNEKIFKPIDISSSGIRKRVREGLPISKLVPEKVKEYIIKNKLYL